MKSVQQHASRLYYRVQIHLVWEHDFIEALLLPILSRDSYRGRDKDADSLRRRGWLHEKRPMGNPFRLDADRIKFDERDPRDSQSD